MRTLTTGRPFNSKAPLRSTSFRSRNARTRVARAVSGWNGGGAKKSSDMALFGRHLREHEVSHAVRDRARPPGQYDFTRWRAPLRPALALDAGCGDDEG